MNDPFRKCIGILTAGMLMSCSMGSSDGGRWEPVADGKRRDPIDAEEVLLMDEFPSCPYVHVGSFTPTPGTNPRLNMDYSDAERVRYFKSRAAAMGGNTVVILEPRVNYKSSSRDAGTRVEVIYVREEEGTHGGDDIGSSSDVVPMNEELMQIY